MSTNQLITLAGPIHEDGKSLYNAHINLGLNVTLKHSIHYNHSVSITAPDLATALRLLANTVEKLAKPNQ